MKGAILSLGVGRGGGVGVVEKTEILKDYSFFSLQMG